MYTLVIYGLESDICNKKPMIFMSFLVQLRIINILLKQKDIENITDNSRYLMIISSTVLYPYQLFS